MLYPTATSKTFYSFSFFFFHFPSFFLAPFSTHLLVAWYVLFYTFLHAQATMCSLSTDTQRADLFGHLFASNEMRLHILSDFVFSTEENPCISTRRLFPRCEPLWDQEIWEQFSLSCYLKALNRSHYLLRLTFPTCEMGACNCLCDFTELLWANCWVSIFVCIHNKPLLVRPWQSTDSVFHLLYSKHPWHIGVSVPLLRPFTHLAWNTLRPAPLVQVLPTPPGPVQILFLVCNCLWCLQLELLSSFSGSFTFCIIHLLSCCIWL